MTSLRRRMIEDMQIRNLAVNTQKSYVQQVSLFAQYFQKSPDLLGPEHIRAYQVYLTNEKKLTTTWLRDGTTIRRAIQESTGTRPDGPLAALHAGMHLCSSRSI